MRYFPNCREAWRRDSSSLLVLEANGGIKSLRAFTVYDAKGTPESLDTSVCLGLPHSRQPGSVGKKKSMNICEGHYSVKVQMCSLIEISFLSLPRALHNNSHISRRLINIY